MCIVLAVFGKQFNMAASALNTAITLHFAIECNLSSIIPRFESITNKIYVFRLNFQDSRNHQPFSRGVSYRLSKDAMLLPKLNPVYISVSHRRLVSVWHIQINYLFLRRYGKDRHFFDFDSTVFGHHITWNTSFVLVANSWIGRPNPKSHFGARRLHECAVSRLHWRHQSRRRYPQAGLWPTHCQRHTRPCIRYD